MGGASGVCTGIMLGVGRGGAGFSHTFAVWYTSTRCRQFSQDVGFAKTPAQGAARATSCVVAIATENGVRATTVAAAIPSAFILRPSRNSVALFYFPI
jgi:hypothetical protein